MDKIFHVDYCAIVFVFNLYPFSKQLDRSSNLELLSLIPIVHENKNDVGIEFTVTLTCNQVAHFTPFQVFDII